MPQHTSLYEDYLLKHSRESRRLSIEQVCAKTGITAENYKQMEAGIKIMDVTDADLLGALLSINPFYLERNNVQLMLLYSANELIQIKQKKIASLTNALKRKMKKP